MHFEHDEKELESVADVKLPVKALEVRPNGSWPDLELRSDVTRVEIVKDAPDNLGLAARKAQRIRNRAP